MLPRTAEKISPTKKRPQGRVRRASLQRAVLVGLRIGALAIPGLGPLIAAGPIVAALAGVGAVGTLGGIVGALAGMGIPEYEAKRYEGRIREGGILLSVHCDSSDWVKRAKEVLTNTGAQDIAGADEIKGDFANADKPMPRVRTIGTPPPVTETRPLTSTATVHSDFDETQDL